MNEDLILERHSVRPSTGHDEIADLKSQLASEKEARALVEKRMARLQEQIIQGAVQSSTHSGESLESVSENLKTVLDAILDVIILQDRDHNILYANAAGRRFFGIHRDDALIKRCFKIVGRKSPCDVCPAQSVIETGKSARIEKKMEQQGIWLDIRAYPVKDRHGQVVRVVEQLRDITEIKRLGSQLKQSEYKYRLLVENANDAIFILQEGEFKFYNTKAKEMAAKLGVNLSTKSAADYIHPDDREMVIDRHARRIQGESISDTVSIRLLKADGLSVWVELNSVAIEWKGRPASLNFLRDISRQKKLENQFHEMQRMESIGTLAGGIAHDFNNLLMGIQGNLSLIYLDMDETHPLYAKLESIERCVESGSNLTRQLLGFARGGKYVVKPTNMNDLTRNSSLLFSRTRKDVKIHNNFQKDIWTVEVDQGQIEQVLVNIYLNAWQAMVGGGDIYLKTDNVYLDENFVKPYDVPGGRYICISVADNGVGMDTQIIGRIFEPFFTTKEIGHGTGLGLASAFGIIRNHSGFITVKSSVGKGSTFDIYLPACHKPEEPKIAESDELLSGSETILLVDDEDYIVDVGRLMLESLGYTIHTADCGRAGIEQYRSYMEQIDLVILDMIMPDVSGLEVFDKIKSINPEVKVLLASGYNVDFQASSLLEKGCNGFIQKPFNMKQVSQKIRELLD